MQNIGSDTGLYVDWSFSR